MSLNPRHFSLVVGHRSLMNEQLRILANFCEHLRWLSVS